MVRRHFNVELKQARSVQILLYRLQQKRVTLQSRLLWRQTTTRFAYEALSLRYKNTRKMFRTTLRILIAVSTLCSSQIQQGILLLFNPFNHTFFLAYNFADFTSLISNLKSKCKLHNGEYHIFIATQNVKSLFIRIKVCTRGFLRSLITNLNAKFRNSKW